MIYLIVFVGGVQLFTLYALMHLQYHIHEEILPFIEEQEEKLWAERK